MTEFKSGQESKAPSLSFGINKTVKRETLAANQREFAARKLVKQEEVRRRQAIVDSTKGFRNEQRDHLGRLGRLKNTGSLLTPKPISSLLEHPPEKPSLLTKKPEIRIRV